MALRLAFFLSMVSSYASIIANFAILAFVSRILTPADVGLFVLGNAVVMIFQSLKEFAPCHYFIQRPQLLSHDLRGGITVMGLMNVAIAAGLVLVAPIVSAAYEAPALIPFLQIAAAAVIVDTLAHPIVALLSRDMAFGKVALFTIFNSAFYLITSVTLLLLGSGFLGLAWAWLITSFANAWLALSWRPDILTIRPSLAQWRDVLEYGMRTGSVNSLLQFFEQVPYLLLGRFNSAPLVASYNRAFLVSRLPDRILVNGALQVVLPSVSKSTREGQSVNQPYLHGIEILSGLQWPILILLGLFASSALRILLGPQWAGSAHLLELLVVASAFSFVFPINIRVMAALGAMPQMLRCAVLVLPLSIGIAAGAALLGGEALALSLVIVIPIQAFATFFFVQKQMGWQWRDLLSSLAKSAVVAGCTAIGAFAVCAANEFVDPAPLGVIVLAAFAGFLGWIAGVLLTNHAILSETRRTKRELNNWARRVLFAGE